MSFMTNNATFMAKTSTTDEKISPNNIHNIMILCWNG